MNDERFPRTYEGKALRSLGIDPPCLRIIRRIQVVSETSMIIELANQTIAVDVQAPVHTGRSWTIRIEHTLLPAGSASIIAEAQPIRAIRPALPNAEIIDTAIELSAVVDYQTKQNDRTKQSVLALLEWIAPGAVLSPTFAEGLDSGDVSIGFERTGTADVVTLRILFPGPWGPAASDLFR